MITRTFDMPILYHRCSSCGHQFQGLCFAGDSPDNRKCPRCASADTVILPRQEKLFKDLPDGSPLARDRN